MSAQKLFAQHVWGILGPYKWKIALILGMILISQVLLLVGPYIQGMILDNITQHVAMSKTFGLIALAGLVMMVSHWLVHYPRERYEIKNVGFAIEEAVHGRTISRLLSLSIGQHNAFHSGEKYSIIQRGQHSLTALTFLLIYEITPTIARTLSMTVAIFWLDIVMGVIVFSAVVIFAGLALYQNRIFDYPLLKLEKMWNMDAKLRSEIVQHVSHVLVNAQEKKAQTEADLKYKETADFAKPLWLRFVTYSYVASMVVIVARIAVMAIGAHYVYTGRFSIGMIVVFWAWSSTAFDGLWSIGNQHRQMTKMWSSIQKYCKFLAMESDVKMVPNPVHLHPIHGRIEVKDVSFIHDSRMSSLTDSEGDEFGAVHAQKSKEKTIKPALQNISFMIEPGETVAFVGETGCGKTTLINLLVRSSDPTTGQILIDGHDLRVIDLKKFRRKVGVVEQHVPLFDRSIRENILYGLDGEAMELPDEELERICEISQINRFAHKLEKGFDTFVGERGIKLSGGERQRIGIARALMKDPAILIFDEATSSLDAGVEAEIREAIKEASKGRTTIIIAHRFSTIRYANRIIVMDEGRIVGQGKHYELYHSCEPYRRLVDHQIGEQSKLEFQSMMITDHYGPVTNEERTRSYI